MFSNNQVVVVFVCSGLHRVWWGLGTQMTDMCHCLVIVEGTTYCDTEYWCIWSIVLVSCTLYDVILNTAELVLLLTCELYYY